MKYLFYCFLFSHLFNSLAIAHVENSELKIALFLEPPFVDLIDGELIGENIDIAISLAEAINLKPVFLHCPFARCLIMVEKGQADMIMGIKKLSEREKHLIFIEPPYFLQHQPLRFFTLSSERLSINSFDDLENLIVGTLRGAAYFKRFDDNTEIKKVELTTREQLARMLLKGHIDTFLEREESTIPLLSSDEYQHKISIAQYQYSKSVKGYIAITKNSHIQKYYEELSTHLAMVIDSGMVDKIRARNRAKLNNVKP